MKRSALHYAHQRRGATFGEYSGWELPAFFSSTEQELSQVLANVGIADTSYYAKSDLKSAAGDHSWRLGRGHYLNLGETPDRAQAGIDVTSVYTSLRLVGPRSTAVLGKLTSLNLGSKTFPNRTCAQASLAYVPAIFLRDDIQELFGIHLLVTREYAESVWEAILHAGHEFHISPYGLATLRLLSA